MLVLVTVLVASVRADLTASIRAAAPQLYTAAAAVTPEAANVAISPLSVTSVLARYLSTYLRISTITNPAPCSLYLGCENGSPAQQQLQQLLHTNTSILPTMKRLMADFQVQRSYNSYSFAGWP